MTSPFESHEEFQLACKAFIARYSSPPSASASATVQDLPGPNRTNAGWQWIEHKASVSERFQALSSVPALCCVLCLISGIATGTGIATGNAQRGSTRGRFADAAEQSVFGHGYLHRLVTRARIRDDLPEDEGEGEGESGLEEYEAEDPAAISSRALTRGGQTKVVVEQDVVFSRTYRCPMLCLRAWAEDGAPLPLSSLLDLHILTPPNTTAETAETAETTSKPTSARPDAIMLDLSSPFPLLQQTEHPTTGQVVWSVHPCRVAEAVEEVLADESGAGSVTETERNTNANANAVVDPNKYPKTERKTERKTETKTETKTDTDPEMGTGTLGSDARGGDGDRDRDIAPGGLSGMEEPKRASESMSASTSAPEHSVRWLETWMMLSSTIVDLTYP